MKISIDSVLIIRIFMVIGVFEKFLLIITLTNHLQYSLLCLLLLLFFGLLSVNHIFVKIATWTVVVFPNVVIVIINNICMGWVIHRGSVSIKQVRV